MITISNRKQFDLKYKKKTALALGLTNMQNKRGINWNSTKNVLLTASVIGVHIHSLLNFLTNFLANLHY